MLGPCTQPNPEAEAEAEAESRRGPRLLRAKSSDPHIKRVLTASGTYSPCGRNTLGSQTQRLAYVEANPRPQYRAHATRFGQRRLRFACLNRMQPVARQRSSVQPVAACAVRSGIAHRWHSVATQCMWLQYSACGCNTFCVLLRHTCVAQGQMSRRAAVAAQMWAWAWTRLRCRCGLGWTRADVGWGWTLSQCKGGQWIDSVQLQVWVGGGLGPGADVGGYEPSPVVIDERSPTMQMRAYRG